MGVKSFGVGMVLRSAQILHNADCTILYAYKSQIFVATANFAESVAIILYSC